MSHNFDKFFKEKLEERSYEMEDSYWAEAEQMIEEQEKKRRFGWWWSGLGLLAIISIIGLSLYFNATDTNNNTATVRTENNTSTDTDSKLNETTTASTGTSNTGTASTATKTAVDSKTTIGNTETLENNSSSKASKTNSEDHSSATKNIKTTPSNKSALNKNAASFSGSSNSNFSNNAIQFQETIGNLSPYDLSYLQPYAQPSNDDRSSSISNNVKLSETEVQAMKLELLDAITTLIEELEYPERYKEDLVEQVNPIPKQTKNHKFQIGLKAEYGFSDYYNGGLDVRYLINEKLAVRSGLNFFVHQGDYPFTQTQEIKEYSFGSTIETEVLLASGIQGLELPLLVQYNFAPKHWVEGGLSLNYITAIRGGDASLDFSSETVENAGDYLEGRFAEPQVQKSIVQDGFNSFYTSLEIGYLYELRKNLLVELGATYDVTSPIKNSSELPEAIISGDHRFQQTEVNPLRLKFSVIYYFSKF